MLAEGQFLYDEERGPVIYFGLLGMWEDMDKPPEERRPVTTLLCDGNEFYEAPNVYKSDRFTHFENSDGSAYADNSLIYELGSYWDHLEPENRAIFLPKARADIDALNSTYTFDPVETKLRNGVRLVKREDV